MGVAAGSRERVAERLSGLEEIYGSIPVTQTTVSLSGERFERALAAFEADLVDVYAEVRNEAGDVLHVDDDGCLALPGTAATVDQSLERRVRTAVERATGVECRIAGLSEVTIAGIRDADDEDRTYYRLIVVFSAEHAGGAANGDAAWASQIQQVDGIVG